MFISQRVFEYFFAVRFSDKCCAS